MGEPRGASDGAGGVRAGAEGIGLSARGGSGEGGWHEGERRERGLLRRGPVAGPAVLLVLAAVAWRWDGPASVALRAWWSAQEARGGDVVRELAALQQFGQLAWTLLGMGVVWMLDPLARRKLLDWGAGLGLASLVMQAIKMGVGRPRPVFEDPGVLLWPFGAYPLPGATPPGVYHAWAWWEPISSGLWSMPSSHTGAAAVMAAWMGVVYPRVGPLMVALAAWVGAARVLTGAHYPSDVLIGGAVGWAVGGWAATRFWGVRGLDRVWRVCVDRGARPAWVGLSEGLRGRGVSGG